MDHWLTGPQASLECLLGVNWQCFLLSGVHGNVLFLYKQPGMPAGWGGRDFRTQGKPSDASKSKGQLWGGLCSLLSIPDSYHLELCFIINYYQVISFGQILETQFHHQQAIWPQRTSNFFSTSWSPRQKTRLDNSRDFGVDRMVQGENLGFGQRCKLGLATSVASRACATDTEKTPFKCFTKYAGN